MVAAAKPEELDIRQQAGLSTPQATAPAPEPAEEAVPTPIGERKPVEMQDALADLLRRMDETSEMMRDLRKAS